MNHMYEILARFGWAWTPVAFAVWGVAVYRRRKVAGTMPAAPVPSPGTPGED